MKCRICDRIIKTVHNNPVCNECLVSTEPLAKELASLKEMINTQCESNLSSVLSIGRALELPERTDEVDAAILKLLRQMIKTNTLVIKITNVGASKVESIFVDPDQVELIEEKKE